MIKINCKECNTRVGKVVINVDNEPDTYLDYLNIDYTNATREYIKCDNCGLIYRSFILDSSEKELLYKHFRDFELRHETKEQYFKRIISLPVEDSENYAKCQFLEKYIFKKSKNKILDVGCGAGVFLYTFKEIFNNWQALGIEPTSDFSDIAKKGKFKILNKYLDEHTFDYTFDLITLNHVLEHVENYHQMLIMLESYLDNNGILYIEVPSDLDIGYLDKSHDRFMCQHDVIFSKIFFRNMIKKTVYQIITCENFISKRKRNNLRLLLKKKPK